MIYVKCYNKRRKTMSENNEIRVPFTQQFTPEQTPMENLLILLENSKKSSQELKILIANSFFKDKADPEKLAGNTIISLKTYGIINKDNTLSEFGLLLISNKNEMERVYEIFAKHILINMHGIEIIETLREMKQAALSIQLSTLPDELQKRGFKVKNNSSDLSGLFGWLRKASILNGYNINESVYEAIVGIKVKTIESLMHLDQGQIGFLRALVAMNVEDWIPYNNVCCYAENLFSGEIKYNWKNIMNDVLKPLQENGFIEIRKKEKQSLKTPEGRGGKTSEVKPKTKFFNEIATPILEALYSSAGFQEIRDIRSKSLSDIIQDARQTKDTYKKGVALELLAIRLCQMLDLEFVKWRETDENVTAGGEVDAMLHSSRLIYSRWQVQCKATHITLEAVAKEVGMNAVTLANVILVVGTGSATESAIKYRNRIVSNSNLNIIILEGKHLDAIINDKTALIDILNAQARDTMKNRVDNSIARSRKIDETFVYEEESEYEENFSTSYETSRGTMICGDSLNVLPYLIRNGIRAKLIMTSPPFALIKKKEYGNEDAEEYIDWFMQFVPYFKQILEPNGSLVIDIGGTWIKGLPVKSTYQYKLLLKLCENGFYLAQEFYHYNSAKLPTPAEWVTIRRLRVKDAVNNVWWLVLDPFADADNKRILKPYSESMINLLKNGYKPNLRPSGHDISDKFQKDNGGAIPPNLIEIANTESNSCYMKKCKEMNIKPHPARFPIELPEFFIKYLTKENELVIDPFAGSNVTGEASEKLNRKWIGIELNYEYVVGSKFKFNIQVE
jgi:site-specific DNA-methyltransferase (cytosine-N4-specific)